MKAFFACILSMVIFVASFQKSLIWLDYLLNQDFYEIHCVNKTKPELSCHGKCQAKEQNEKTSSPTELIKVSFEFNLIAQDVIEIPLASPDSFELKNKIQSHSDIILKEGFSKILPNPPQV